MELLRLVTFDYCRRHHKEIDFARACGARLDTLCDVVDINAVGKLLSGSALTDDINVPDGHHAEDSIKLTSAFGIAAVREDLILLQRR